MEGLIGSYNHVAFISDSNGEQCKCLSRGVTKHDPCLKWTILVVGLRWDGRVQGLKQGRWRGIVVIQVRHEGQWDSGKLLGWSQHSLLTFWIWSTRKKKRWLPNFSQSTWKVGVAIHLLRSGSLQWNTTGSKSKVGFAED